MFKIYIFAILIASVASQKCGIGCQACNYDYQSQNMICSKCYDGYELKNGSCVYLGCQPELYFQIDQKNANDSYGSCLSICDPLFYTDTFTNTCQQLQQCSSTYSTQPNYMKSGIPVDFFIYQNQYYVAMYDGFLSIYDKNTLALNKNLKYFQDDLNIYHVNGIITVVKNDFSINVWDILNEVRQNLNSKDLLLISQQYDFTLFQDNYLLMTQFKQQILQFQIIYSKANQQQLISNAIQISQQLQFTYKIVNNFLFLGNQTNLVIYSINYLNQNNNLNTSLQMNFTFENKGNILQVLPTSNQSLFFLIFSNSILQIDNQSCSPLIFLQSIQKVKVIYSQNDLNELHLIILTNQNLIDFNYATKQSNFILSETSIILDFDAGNFSGINNQLILLSNPTQLSIYNFNSIQPLQPFQTVSLIFPSQSLKKVVNQYNSTQYESQINSEIVFFSSSSIQINKQSSRKDSILDTYIIENFNLNFPTPSSQVNSLAYIYSPQLLISCHQNGDIIFYDASRGENINLIQRLSFTNQSCVQLERFNDGKIAALLQYNILLIDPIQQIVINQLTNLTNIIQITSNYDKLVINYNNCLKLISSEFVDLFTECNTAFSSNNLKVDLYDNLYLVIQKQNEISIYQINLGQQLVQELMALQTANKIQYFDTIKLFNTDQDSILNRYSIDEVIYFDDKSNFAICNMQLQITYQTQVSLLQTLVSAEKVINDSSVYFLAGFQPVQGKNSIFLISKNLDQPLLVETFASEYFPNLQESKMLVNQCGSVYYSFKRKVLLNFFTVIKEVQIDINRNITQVGGLEYINIDTESFYLNRIIGIPQNFLNYVGTQSGLIYTIKQQSWRYQQLKTDSILSINVSNDEIQEIIQSAELGMYFVRTKNQITSFNIFTNQFIEQLSPQTSSDPPFTSFELTQDNKGIVCWNQYQLLYVAYEINPQKNYFNGMNYINGWIFNPSSNQYYIYGSNFQLLTYELKPLQIYTPEKQQNISFIQCKYTPQIIVCSASINQFVIVKQLINQFTIQNVAVNGFASQYQVAIDDQNQNIFLYSDLIQVYNFNGVFNLQHTLSSQVLSYSIASDRILFQSLSYIYFIDRISLKLNDNYIYSPSGMPIENYMYIDFLNQIVIYTNDNTFAQIYIYDSQSLQNIAKINGSFSSNQLGIALNMYLDKSSASLIYLDIYGNLLIYNLFSDFPFQDTYIITEVVNRNEKLLSFSYEEITNNILVYSTKSVYQMDYSLSGYSYEAQLNEPSNLYAQIPIIGQNLSFDFLFFNNDNVVFRYSNFHINFERIIDGSQVIDILYNQAQDTLIVAQKDQITFYLNYQYSNQNNQLPQQKAIKQIQFFRFLQNNLILTYDQKIIYYDPIKGQIIDTVQLQASIVVTYQISSQDLSKLFVGFSNGQALQYNLGDLSKQYYSISNNNQLYTSIISIVLDETNFQAQKAYFATNGGILLIVDIINKKVIQEINLISLVNEDPSIILHFFCLEPIYSRYIFIFNGQKMAYVWNFSKNQQEQYLSLTKNQGNKIQIIQNYIITFCTFQLNIYNISDKITLVTVIKRNLSNDQITDYQLINNNIIIIFFVSKYEVFLIQNNQSSIIFQQIYNYPRYLGSIYNQEENILKLYGIHQAGVFENDYSITIYTNDQYTICSTVVSDNDISQLNQKISSITPKQDQIDTIYGSSTQNEKNWRELIYLQVENNQFKNFNQQQYLNQLTNSIFLFYPNQNNNNLTVANDTFYYFQQSQLLMFDYNFIFQQNNTKTLVNFNQNVQNITWKNISISGQCINNIQVNISNIQQVILQSIQLTQLSNCGENDKSDYYPYFFSFYNILQVYIYDLEISGLGQFSNSYYSLFNLDNINTILIDGVIINNNQNINSFFQFTSVKNIIIRNVDMNRDIISSRINQQQTNYSRQQSHENTPKVFQKFRLQAQQNQMKESKDLSPTNQFFLTISKETQNFRTEYNKNDQDFILESYQNQQESEELDPKKVKKYSFLAKSSLNYSKQSTLL
ncbi:hypothetical protein ABPG73_022459 [Tetrahymena malaccensis]